LCRWRGGAADGLHLRWALRAAGHPLPVTARPAAVGESNHVYEVTDAGGHELIVRIASRADPRFTMEVAVMARARLAGVPVPEVLAVFRHDTPDGTMTAMVERRVPGQRLAVVAPTLDARSAATLATNLAEMLATIHAIRVHGYGTVDEHLAGQTATCSEWFIDRLPLDRAQTAVAADPRGAAVLDAAATALHRHRGLLDASPAQLAHGDYSPNNILVSGGEGRAARGTTLRGARTVIRGVIRLGVRQGRPSGDRLRVVGLDLQPATVIDRGHHRRLPRCPRHQYGRTHGPARAVPSPHPHQPPRLVGR